MSNPGTSKASTGLKPRATGTKNKTSSALYNKKTGLELKCTTSKADSTSTKSKKTGTVGSLWDFKPRLNVPSHFVNMNRPVSSAEKKKKTSGVAIVKKTDLQPKTIRAKADSTPGTKLTPVKKSNNVVININVQGAGTQGLALVATPGKTSEARTQGSGLSPRTVQSRQCHPEPINQNSGAACAVVTPSKLCSPMKKHQYELFSPRSGAVYQIVKSSLCASPKSPLKYSSPCTNFLNDDSSDNEELPPNNGLCSICNSDVCPI